MKLIEFNNSSSREVYNNYIARCKKATKVLSDADREECLLEINSHIYEYIQDHTATDELENLKTVLQQLGEPEVTLKEYVAAKKIDQAVTTFNPKHLIQALYFNIRNGIMYIFLSVLTLFFCCFFLLAVFKIIYPNNVGFYYSDDNFMFGYTTIPDPANELLGFWFSPLMLVISALLYLLCVFILKGIKKVKKV